VSDSDPDLERAQEHLRALYARFEVSLRERLARLEELVAAARQGTGGALEEALVVAHRLAGTAGSYGYQEVGEAAAAVESALRGIADGTMGAGAWDEAEAALARARAGSSARG